MENCRNGIREFIETLTHAINIGSVDSAAGTIGTAVFPTYFLKERDKADQIHCQLDIEIFTKYYAPPFSITRRYVGSEPFSAMTDRHNQALKAYLPAKQIEIKELPRLEINGAPVSASAVRSLIAAGQTTEAKALVPQTTFHYLQAKGLL